MERRVKSLFFGERWCWRERKDGEEERKMVSLRIRRARSPFASTNAASEKPLEPVVSAAEGSEEL